MTCPLFVIPKLRAFLNCHPEITLFLFLVISGSRVSAWDDSILFVISKLFSFLNCHPGNYEPSYFVIPGRDPGSKSNSGR